MKGPSGRGLNNWWTCSFWTTFEFCIIRYLKQLLKLIWLLAFFDISVLASSCQLVMLSYVSNIDLTLKIASTSSLSHQFLTFLGVFGKAAKIGQNRPSEEQRLEEPRQKAANSKQAPKERQEGPKRARGTTPRVWFPCGSPAAVSYRYTGVQV